MPVRIWPIFLSRRASQLPKPIQMSDALVRNAPKSLEILVANCLAHGRRKFVVRLESQLADKKVEPNSGLDKAIQFMLRHWEPLTR
jgi:hypothetical protein